MDTHLRDKVIDKSVLRIKAVVFVSRLVAIIAVAIIFCGTSNAGVLLDSLNSKDEKKIEYACNAMELPRGVSGLSKIQIIQSSNMQLREGFSLVLMSWEGLFDGYAVLLDPSEKIIAKKRLGFVKNISMRALEEGGYDVVLIDAIKGAGTGMKEDHFLLFSITEHGFTDIWNGISFEKSFPMLLASEDNYDIRASIEFIDIDNDGVSEIKYSQKKQFYVSDGKTNKLRQGKQEEHSELYKLIKGKYVLISN